MREGGAQELARALEQNMSITHLNVGVRLWRKRVECIAVLSTHECVQDNEIGEGGSRELARALALNTGITNLDLSVCFKDRGGREHCGFRGWDL